MQDSMLKILRGLSAVTLISGAVTAMAADDGTCQNDPVSNDSCYRLLVEAKRECTKHTRWADWTVANLRLQCQQIDGMGRCVKAQYQCIREGRVQHYGIAMGVRG